MPAPCAMIGPVSLRTLILPLKSKQVLIGVFALSILSAGVARAGSSCRSLEAEVAEETEVAQLKKIVAELKAHPKIKACDDSDVDLRSVAVGFKCVTPKGNVFERVARDRFGEAWKGPDHLIWSDVIGVDYNQSQLNAVKTCENLNAALPTQEDFKKGEALGFRKVLPHMNSWWWSSSLYPTHPDEAYDFYGGTGSISWCNRDRCGAAVRCVVREGGAERPEEGPVHPAKIDVSVDPNILPLGAARSDNSCKTLKEEALRLKERVLRLISNSDIKACDEAGLDLRSVAVGFRCYTSKGAVFQRVARDHFGNAWKGLDGLIWSEPVAVGKYSLATQYNAVKVCRKLGGTLPDKGDFERGEANSVREVLPLNSLSRFWSSSVIELPDLRPQRFAFTFDANTGRSDFWDMVDDVPSNSVLCIGR